MAIGLAAELGVIVPWSASSGAKSTSARMKEKAVALNVEVDGSAPSFAQSTHRKHVISVQHANTRAPSGVSSWGAAAKRERASTSGQSSATTAESARRPATNSSHTRRLDCAGDIRCSA